MKQLQIDFESAAATGAHALFLQFVARAEAYGYEKYRCCTEVLRYDATLHKGDNTIYLHPAPIWNSTHFQTGVDYSKLYAIGFRRGETMYHKPDQWGRCKAYRPYLDHREQEIASIEEIEKFLGEMPTT